ESKVTTRYRLFFYMQDTQPDVPLLKQRLLNGFVDFGDDMVRVSGIGELAVSWNARGATIAPNYETALGLIARSGWTFQQHSLSEAEDQFTVSTFEKVNATTPIAGLHWQIAHVPLITDTLVNRLKAIGAGLAVHPTGRYL